MKLSVIIISAGLMFCGGFMLGHHLGQKEGQIDGFGNAISASSMLILHICTNVHHFTAEGVRLHCSPAKLL